MGKNKKQKSSINPNIEKDDAEIKYYERKLSMKLKTSKKEFLKDGLSDLLDFCDDKEANLLDFELNEDQPEEIAQNDFQPFKKSKNLNDKKRKLNNSDQSDNESIDNLNKLNLKNKSFNLKDNKQLNKINEQEPTKWISKRLLEKKLEFERSKKNLNNKDDDFSNYDEEEDFDDDEEEDFDDEEFIDNNDDLGELDNKQYSSNKLKEDIYGRLINENGEIIKENKTINLTTDSEIEKELTKKVRGLMNRMALKTLPFIVNELEQLFQKHSNNLVCRCLFNCIDQLVISDHTLASQKLCTEIAMLIAICHSRIGEEISANVLHQLVKTLDLMFIELKINSNDQITNKQFENILMIICSMYGVNIIGDELIYNILDKLIEQFNSKSIELILFCLKLVGYLLRKDNTSLMKNLILNVQQKANSFDKEKINEKKVIFMLNALTSIKNNVNLKMDLSDIQSIISIDKQKIKNELKLLFKDIQINCLKGKYNEILKSNRWFVHSGELLEISMKRKIEKQKEISLPNLNDKLCKKLQLTTPFRKLIFNTIFTCEDYIECSQNIIKLTKKDHFEVILICLHICLNEKQFNPFYIHLLRYLSHTDRNFKRGILFNIKEKIKNIDNLNDKQKLNLQSLIIELIKLNVLSLIVFEVIDFADINELYKDFMIFILDKLFNDLELIKLDELFKRLPKKSQLSTSIKVFINIFLSDNAKHKLKQLKTGLIKQNKIF